MPSIRKISPGQVDAKPQTNSSLNAEPAEEDLGVCGKTIAYIILFIVSPVILAGCIVVGCVVLAGGIIVLALGFVSLVIGFLFVIGILSMPYAINYIYCLDKACKSPIIVQQHTGEVASNATLQKGIVMDEMTNLLLQSNYSSPATMIHMYCEHVPNELNYAFFEPAELIVSAIILVANIVGIYTMFLIVKYLLRKYRCIVMVEKIQGFESKATKTLTMNQQTASQKKAALGQVLNAGNEFVLETAASSKAPMANKLTEKTVKISENIEFTEEAQHAFFWSLQIVIGLYYCIDYIYNHMAFGNRAGVGLNFCLVIQLQFMWLYKPVSIPFFICCINLFEFNSTESREKGKEVEFEFIGTVMNPFSLLHNTNVWRRRKKIRELEKKLICLQGLKSQLPNVEQGMVLEYAPAILDDDKYLKQVIWRKLIFLRQLIQHGKRTLYKCFKLKFTAMELTEEEKIKKLIEEVMDSTTLEIVNSSRNIVYFERPGVLAILSSVTFVILGFCVMPTVYPLVGISYLLLPLFLMYQFVIFLIFKFMHWAIVFAFYKLPEYLEKGNYGVFKNKTTSEIWANMHLESDNLKHLLVLTLQRIQLLTGLVAYFLTCYFIVVYVDFDNFNLIIGSVVQSVWRSFTFSFDFSWFAWPNFSFEIDIKFSIGLSVFFINRVLAFWGGFYKTMHEKKEESAFFKKPLIDSTAVINNAIHLGISKDNIYRMFIEQAEPTIFEELGSMRLFDCDGINNDNQVYSQVLCGLGEILQSKDKDNALEHLFLCVIGIVSGNGVDASSVFMLLEDIGISEEVLIQFSLRYIEYKMTVLEFPVEATTALNNHIRNKLEDKSSGGSQHTMSGDLRNFLNPIMGGNISGQLVIQIFQYFGISHKCAIQWVAIAVLNCADNVLRSSGMYLDKIYYKKLEKMICRNLENMINIEEEKPVGKMGGGVSAKQEKENANVFAASKIIFNMSGGGFSDENMYYLLEYIFDCSRGEANKHFLRAIEFYTWTQFESMGIPFKLILLISEKIYLHKRSGKEKKKILTAGMPLICGRINKANVFRFLKVVGIDEKTAKGMILEATTIFLNKKFTSMKFAEEDINDINTKLIACIEKSLEKKKGEDKKKRIPNSIGKDMIIDIVMPLMCGNVNEKNILCLLEYIGLSKETAIKMIVKAIKPYLENQLYLMSIPEETLKMTVEKIHDMQKAVDGDKQTKSNALMRAGMPLICGRINKANVFRFLKVVGIDEKTAKGMILEATTIFLNKKFTSMKFAEEDINDINTKLIACIEKSLEKKKGEDKKKRIPNSIGKDMIIDIVMPLMCGNVNEKNILCLLEYIGLSKETAIKMIVKAIKPYLENQLQSMDVSKAEMSKLEKNRKNIDQISKSGDRLEYKSSPVIRAVIPLMCGEISNSSVFRFLRVLGIKQPTKDSILGVIKNHKEKNEKVINVNG